MESETSKLNLSWPFWQDYRSVLTQLNWTNFPTADELCKLLPAGLQSRGGESIRFVTASEIPGVSYENHIFNTGQVSTRTENWHDLFNALVWSRFPQLKTAMNAVHFNQQKMQQTPQRGRLRDALTLLDESGAVVVSARRNMLDAVAMHDWKHVFGTGFFSQRDLDSQGGLKIFLTGHALLEKFLDPYKSITAKVLLVEVSETAFTLPREEFRSALDHGLAEALLNGTLFGSPADLSPLPLMGIQGWWPHGDQDDTFYADPDVFRPLRRLSPTPVFKLL